MSQFNDDANQQNESITCKHTHKKLIRRVIFEDANLLTLKWPQNKMEKSKKTEKKKEK